MTRDDSNLLWWLVGLISGIGLMVVFNVLDTLRSIR
jgi:uncharacterized membrane protein